jgi:uncharacterized repeat protein (TIGR01451 family)
MRFGRWLPTLSALAAAAVALMVLAGSGAAANGAGLAQPTWTLAKAKGYMRSLGIDPRSVVVQSGKRNYAGPRCPGKNWNCTMAKHVIQIGRSFSSVITNKFTCKGATTGTDAGTNTCVVVQISTTADNDARCFLTDYTSKESDNSQTCTITQTNGSGRNFAWATQDLRQYDAATETGKQHVTIKQTNRAGNNEALVTQTLIQNSVFTAATLTQMQEARQDVGVDQTSGSGSNSSEVHQSLQLRAVVFSGQGAISQSQDTVDAGPNTLAKISQVSGSGTNGSTLQQYNRLEAQATSKKGPVTQKQGSTTGGIRGEVHQDSTGVSTTTSTHDEDQIAHATTPPGTLTQDQIGPVYCCGVGSSTGNGGNSVTITETGHQESDAGGSQFNSDEAACRSSGTCSTHQAKDNNTDSISVDDSCEGSVESPCIVDRIVECSSEGCTTFPVESGSPDSTLTKGVRNVSSGETEFDGSTTVFSGGQTIEYQLRYTNNGDGTAHDVNLFDTPPSSFDFASCTGGCEVILEGGTLHWALGDVPAGETRTVTFRGAASCIDTSNTGSGSDDEEPDGFTSNAATTSDGCIN